MRDENSYWRGFYDARYGLAHSSIGEDVIAPLLFWGLGLVAFFATSIVLTTFTDIALTYWEIEVASGLLVALIIANVVLSLAGAFVLLLALHHVLRLLIGTNWVFWSFTGLWVVGALIFVMLVYNPVLADPASASETEVVALAIVGALVLTIPWLIAQAVLRLFLLKSSDYWG